MPRHGARTSGWPTVPALPDFQRAFLRDLLAEPDAAPASRGFEVYRANCVGNFRDALASAFPLLAALLGADGFARLARDYQRARPSRAGNLFAIGARLPEFLYADPLRPAALAAVARVEWAMQECLVAPDADMRFDEAALARLPAEQHGELRFNLHPAARLCMTGWPVMEWWRSLQASAPPGPADLQAARAGVEHLLVRRAEDGMELHRLRAADYALLSSFGRGETLQGALAAALAVDPAFDVAARMRAWAGERLLRPLLPAEG